MTASGWDLGVRVTAAVDDENHDVIFLHATGGSHAADPGQYLGRVVLVDGRPEFQYRS
jgi:hypothetical protein